MPNKARFIFEKFFVLVFFRRLFYCEKQKNLKYKRPQISKVNILSHILHLVFFLITFKVKSKTNI